MAGNSDIFKNNAFQFVARYVYDSGEVSALGVISKVVKQREDLDLDNNFFGGVSALEISIEDDYPTYAKNMEVYARRGNEGVWYRVKTFDIENDVSAGELRFTFTGDLFEALDGISSAKPFDVVPIETKAIEVADNRVFLANNKDDYDSGNANIFISLDATAQELSDSASTDDPISYLRYSSTASERVDTYDTDKYASPFANDSEYKIGVALYDEYLRTRGVEDTVDFKTGNFDYPLYPNITLTKGGGAGFPSWAKYYQLLVTKNLSKDYSVEGYASSYYWRLNDDTLTEVRQLDATTRGNIKDLVVDLSGMIRAGYSYTFQEGDRINMNFDSTGTLKVIRNLRVLGQADNLLYVEFPSKDGFDADAWDGSNNTEVYRIFFEIYSPSNNNDVVIYYESGNIRPITDFDSSSTVDFNLASTEGYLSGDMCFQNIEIRGYNAASIPVDDSLPSDPVLDQLYKVLIRKVDATKSGAEWDVGIGKASIEYDGLQRQRSISKIRHGGRYIQGTSINSISSFEFTSEAEVPFENGAITALQRTNKIQEEGSVMLAICERETSSLYLGEVVLNDVNGSNAVSTSDLVIGTVRNLKGSYGTTSKKSVVGYQGNVYFWDGIKKKVVRYGANGLAPISDIGMKSYFLGKSGDCKGYYDPFHNMYFIAFDSDDSGDQALSAGFSEVNDRWISFYDHPVDIGVVRDDKMVLMSNQNYYVSLAQSATFRIYGTSQDAYIQYVMNTQTPEMPENVKVYSSMDVVDYANTNNIESNLIRLTITNEKGQTTSLVEGNFLLDNYNLYAHVLRDSGSAGGILEGDYMEGQVHEIKVDLRSSTQETRINGIIVGTIQSQGHLG